MIVKNKKGFYQLPEFLLPGVIHGFSTQKFGNMGYDFGIWDEVSQNRIHFAKAVGFDVNKTAQMHQVHGVTVKIVTKQDISSLTRPIWIPKTDAVITNIPGVALWLTSADCGPFLFFDQKKKVIALAHVGRLGAEKDLPIIVLDSLKENFGSNYSEILVGVGPTVEKCCYFVDFLGDSVGKLRKAGVKNIVTADYCVRHLPGFFSHRATVETGVSEGRFATVLQIQ